MTDDLYCIKVKHTLPALNPAEPLALRKLRIFLLLQTLCLSPCQMRLWCWQKKIHSQWRARTLQKQVVHPWRQKGGHVSQTAVGSLGSVCVTVDWFAGLYVQGSKSAQEQRSDRHVCDDLEKQNENQILSCSICEVDFKTYSFVLFL